MDDFAGILAVAITRLLSLDDIALDFIIGTTSRATDKMASNASLGE